MDSKIRAIEGELNARGLRVGIVAARFNDFIVDRLLAAAIATLLEHGAEAKAGEASRGLAALALEHELAFGFGVLTCDTLEQAIERAGSKSGNKGADAALAAIQMATVLRQMEQ